MFRTELGKPTLYEGGFFDFFDAGVVPLLSRHRDQRGEGARSVAHHVIAPALSPTDAAAFQEFKERTRDASELIGLDYKRRIAAARLMGCATSRLVIVPGNRVDTPLNGTFLEWERNVCKPVHEEEVGEGCKVSWWDEQRQSMAASLAGDAGQVLLRAFADGIERDFPVGGHWTIYGDKEMEQPLVVAEVMYSRDGDQVTFLGFHAYEPDQLTSETQRYVRFWRNVHFSNQATTTLFEMLAIP